MPESGVLVFNETTAYRVQGQAVEDFHLMGGALPQFITERGRLFTGPAVTAMNLQTGKVEWIAPVPGESVEPLDDGGLALLDFDGVLHMLDSRGVEVASGRLLPHDEQAGFDDYTNGLYWGVGRWICTRKGRLIGLSGPEIQPYCCWFHGGIDRR